MWIRSESSIDNSSRENEKPGNRSLDKDNRCIYIPRCRMNPVAAVPRTPARTPAVLDNPNNTPCKFDAGILKERKWFMIPEGRTWQRKIRGDK